MAWLRSYRESKPVKVLDLKPILLNLELPWETDPRKKRKWVELLLVRSRPEAPKQTPLSEAARNAIAKRKREVKKLKEDLQEIVITRPGTYLGRTGERLSIRREGKREPEIPLHAIRNISFPRRKPGSPVARRG